MSFHGSEYHGSPAQRALMQRADPLWRIVRDDPRFCSHGRDVQVADHADDDLSLQISLARIQGAAGCCGVRRADAPARRSLLEAAGFAVDEYEEWHSDATCLNAAAGVVAARRLPDGVEVQQVSDGTGPDVMTQLDAVTQACGVLLPNGAFIRGQEREGVCFFATDPKGDVIAAAASVTQFHPTHARGEQAWWGMLATHPDSRGQGLAIILGAMAILAMDQQFGVSSFYTGIRAGNAPSEKLCAALGLVRTDGVDMIAVDTTQIPDGRTTK